MPVAIKEDFFDILYNIHSLQHGHVGQNRTFEIVAMRYHHLPRVYSDNFVKRCSICNLNLVQQSQPRLKPIRSDNLLERFQIDLVDTRHNK